MPDDTDAIISAAFVKVLGYDPCASEPRWVPPVQPARISKARLLEMAGRGLKHEQIAAQLGCSRSYVSMVARKHGLWRRRPLRKAPNA